MSPDFPEVRHAGPLPVPERWPVPGGVWRLLDGFTANVLPDRGARARECGRLPRPGDPERWLRSRPGTTASIPDEQTLSGLRPIPPGALPSVPLLRPRFTQVEYPYASPATPTPPALRAPPPPPPPGARAAMAIASGKAVPGDGAGGGFPEGSDEVQELARTRFSPGFSPCTGLWWISPRRGAVRGDTGEKLSHEMHPPG